jgi:hypothetical protein
MAYLQLSLLHIPAVVIHGDSLTQEAWERRPTPMLTLMARGRRRPGNAMPTPQADAASRPPDSWLPGRPLAFHF